MRHSVFYFITMSGCDLRMRVKGNGSGEITFSCRNMFCWLWLKQDQKMTLH